jgi:ubiquinone/menaquinone biosynthesis C-methylase UbiE
MGRFSDSVRVKVQDWMMRRMDEHRPSTLEPAQGKVLEVGFGTGLNLRHYPASVSSVAGIDPLVGLAPRVQERMRAAPFAVEHFALRADGELPFEAGCFDTLVTTWTLCSIPDPLRALAEMRRVLRPGGQYLFVEHGRSEQPGTARWQDRLNPLWVHIADGCNMNRRIESLVQEGGFELASCERFLGEGPRVLATMFRGVATRAA